MQKPHNLVAIFAKAKHLGRAGAGLIKLKEIAKDWQVLPAPTIDTC